MLLAFFGFTKAQDIRESFESWLPAEWTISRDFGAKGDWQQSDLSETGAPAAVDGTHAAMIDFASLPYVRLGLITPERDFTSYTNPELSFSWYKSGANADKSYLEVYVSYKKDSFELLEVIPTNLATDGWQTYARVLNRGVKQVKLLGVRQGGGAGGGSLYVDLFQIKEGDACSYPNNLTTALVPGIDGSVRFAWEPSNDENAWNLKIATKSIDPATETADVATESVADEPHYTAENLEMGKTYYWYVQTRCGEAGGRWIAGKPVTVAKSPLIAPFLIDFEENDGDFVAIQEGQLNAWYLGDQPYDQEANRCFFISEDGGETYTYTGEQESRSYLYRDIALPDAENGFSLEVDFRGIGSNPNHAMEIFLAEDLDYYPVAGAFVDFTKARKIGNFCESPEWSHRKVEIPASYAGKTVRLIIGWRNNSYQKVMNPPAAFDNLSIEKLTCPLPKNLTMVANTLNSITLMWDTIAGLTEKWELEYGPYGFEPGEGTTVTVEQKPPFELKGLDTCAFYDVIIKAWCGSGENAVLSEPSARLHAETACPARTAPYFDNFDTLKDNQFPLGWSYVSADRNYMPYLMASEFYAYSQPNAMMLNSVTGITGMGMVSPELTDLGQQDKRVRFYARLAGPATLEVGVMKSPEDTASYIVLHQIKGSDYPEYNEQGQPIAGMFRHTVYLDDARITDEYKHVVLRMARNGATMQAGSIDDFLYETIPSCIEPTNLRPVDISTNSVRLTWDAQGGETQWEVICGEGSFVPANDAEGTPVKETTATIDKLTPGTFYRAYVRAVCSETEKGPWSDAFLFKTCSDGALPLMENFDAVNLFEIPLCWAVRDAESLWKIQKGQAYSAPYAMVYPANKPKVNDWLFTPQLPFEANKTYRITFRAKKLSVRDAVLRIFYGQTPDTAGMTDLITVIDSLSTDYTMVRGFFTPKATGDYHIGLNFESAVSAGLAIDDVGIMATVGTEEVLTETFRIYPNPVDETLYIDLGKTETAAVAIYGMNGNMLRYIPAYSNGTGISVRELPSGAYFVRITDKGNTSVHKIIVR